MTMGKRRPRCPYCDLLSPCGNAECSRRMEKQQAENGELDYVNEPVGSTFTKGAGGGVRVIKSVRSLGG